MKSGLARSLEDWDLDGDWEVVQADAGTLRCLNCGETEQAACVDLHVCPRHARDDADT